MNLDDQLQNNQSDVEIEDEEIYEETGDIIFETALLRYLPSLSEEEAENFQNYIETNVAKQTFLEDLYRDWPEFGQIIEEEMKNLTEDFSSVMKAIESD